MHPSKRCWIPVAALLLCCSGRETFRPETDWGHWRLGQKADPAFLRKNAMTITFGSGAPNFETTPRDTFNKAMEKAASFNKAWHDSGMIVLRYLSTSLNGRTDTPSDIPEKGQIEWLRFYHESWDSYADYIGPKPQDDPTSWITVRPDGSFPFYRYAPYGEKVGRGFETWGCPNNPDYVRMMEGRIRAQAETGIDGSYVDWTQIAGGTCYCRFCKEAFIRFLKEEFPPQSALVKYGTSDYDRIVLPQKRGDAFWMEWLMFRGRTVARFHERLRTEARKVNPHFMISGNVFGGFGYGPIAYDAAGNMEWLGEVDDFLYSEIQEFLDSAPRRDENGTRITNSPALKFLSAATRGKPVIVYATEITPPIFPNPGEEVLSAMARINIAEAVANHCVFREKRMTPPGATEIYRFLAGNERRLVGSGLSSNVAVLASLHPYLADQPSFAFSLSRVLSDVGIGHVMILEKDILERRTQGIELIVVPHVALLSSAVQDSLAAFVRSGGTLVLLGACGSRDEWNVPVTDPALGRLFGSGFPGEAKTAEVGSGKAIYIPLEFPESGFLIPMKAKGEFTTFGPTMADLFPDIPEGYTRGRIDSSLYRILVDVSLQLPEMLSGAVNGINAAFPYLEMTTMANPEKKAVLFHLVNYDVTLDGVLTPARDVQIRVVLPEGWKAGKVTFSGSLGPMKPVSFSTRNVGRHQVITLALDEVQAYGLGVVEAR